MHCSPKNHQNSKFQVQDNNLDMFEEKKNALILIKKNISTDLLSKNHTVSEKAKHKIQNSQQNILGKRIVSF